MLFLKFLHRSQQAHKCQDLQFLVFVTKITFNLRILIQFKVNCKICINPDLTKDIYKHLVQMVLLYRKVPGTANDFQTY